MMFAVVRKRLMAKTDATLTYGGYVSSTQKSRFCMSSKVSSKPLLLITDVDETLIGSAVRSFFDFDCADMVEYANHLQASFLCVGEAVLTF